MLRPSICLELIYEDLPFLDRVDRVAAYGFDTVEFWTWSDKDLEAVETRVDEHDLSVAAMVAHRENARPEELTRALTDPTQREAVTADIEASIERAVRLGCPTLIVLTGPTQDTSHEATRDSVVEGLRRVAPTAESAGVTLVVEPLNTVVDHEGYFLETARTGYEIVRAVDSPAVKLLFDVYHQQITEGNVISNLTRDVDMIGHVHAADVPGRHEPGTGELQYQNILAALAAAGYDRYVGFELAPAQETETALDAIETVLE
jgi:hydroxypyruvate isomerase